MATTHNSGEASTREPHECSYWQRRTKLFEENENPTREQLLKLYEDDRSDRPCGGVTYLPPDEKDPWGAQVTCEPCRSEFDLDGDGVYVPPKVLGEKTLIWVNAYSITRHWGGPEEGGWWYNRGEALASMPIPATFQLPENEDDLVPVPNVPELVESYRQHLEAIFGELRHGNIGSVLGGMDVRVSVEEHQARNWPERTPRYE